MWVGELVESKARKMFRIFNQLYVMAPSRHKSYAKINLKLKHSPGEKVVVTVDDWAGPWA